jgi:hypothetical protein
MTQSLRVTRLAHIKNTPTLTPVGEAMDDIVNGIQNHAAATTTDPNGADIIPVNVSIVQAQHVGNGQIDIAITDNSSLSRSINYFVDYSMDSNFTNPYTLSLGPSRNNHTLVLPNGTWYFQGYSQYVHGGPPSNPVRVRLPVAVTGSSSGKLFSSQGSGTAKPSTGGGQGAGKANLR